MAEVDNMPGHLIRRFHQISVGIFHNEVGSVGCDLTPIQYAALNKLSHNAGVDQVTLAGLIACDRTTIAGVVDRLCQKGLLSREVNVRDRRARQLLVTDAGMALLDMINGAVENAQVSMLRGLTALEATEFLRLLRKATADVNEFSRAPLRQECKESVS